jgi:hypothetical protein
MNNPTNISVGKGPITIAGLLTAAVSGLLFLATFLTTLTGSLPEGLPNSVGYWLTTVSGVVTALSLAITAASRQYFAKTKANIAIAHAYANPATLTADVGDSAAAYVNDPVVSDTNVTPPITPVN